MEKEYPKYNEKELDDLSKIKFDKLQEVIKSYYDMKFGYDDDTNAYNIAFLILTN